MYIETDSRTDAQTGNVRTQRRKGFKCVAYQVLFHNHFPISLSPNCSFVVCALSRSLSWSIFLSVCALLDAVQPVGPHKYAKFLRLVGASANDRV